MTQDSDKIAAALSIAKGIIAPFEGFCGEPYQDVAGIWTYGYGFITESSGCRVTETTCAIDETDAKCRLEAIVSKTLNAVAGMVYVPLTTNQIAALTSFAYNVGTGALRTSHTVLAPLNAGEYQVAADGLMQWVFCSGVRVQGLANRRAAERALFLTPDEGS